MPPFWRLSGKACAPTGRPCPPALSILTRVTCAQRLQNKGFLRREADDAMTQRAASPGMSVKESGCCAGHGRQVAIKSSAVENLVNLKELHGFHTK